MVVPSCELSVFMVVSSGWRHRRRCMHREPCPQCGRAEVLHPAPAAPGSATTWQLASWVWDPGLVMGSALGDQRAGPARGAVRDRRRELGAFLRSRRARLRPAEVGLADWGVRRVPGLRREEVAQLANVGLTWYTWLEQGRQARRHVPGRDDRPPR